MRCDTPMTLEEAKARLGIVDRKSMPMTNEEYLRSCTNEELQWVLWHIRYDRESPWAGKLIDDWLKQPHSEVAE